MVTKSTPMGSLDFPFNPLSLAIGAEATFVARAIDTDKAGMTEVLRAAAAHRGSAFVEIFQNCPIFNDDAWEFVRDDKEGVNRIVLHDGSPILWGKDHEKALRQRTDGSIEGLRGGRRRRARPRRDGARAPSLAFALSRVTQATHGGTPVGIFRDVERPVYDELMAEQIETATAKRGAGDLAALLHERRDLDDRLTGFGFLLLEREVEVVAVRMHVERHVVEHGCGCFVEEHDRAALPDDLVPVASL